MRPAGHWPIVAYMPTASRWRASVSGCAAAVAVALGAFQLAFALIVLNRIMDGLDGAVARATTPTDSGGYLDIVVDYVFYGSVPLAFAHLRSCQQRRSCSSVARVILPDLLEFPCIRDHRRQAQPRNHGTRQEVVLLFDRHRRGHGDDRVFSAHDGAAGVVPAAGVDLQRPVCADRDTAFGAGTEAVLIEICSTRSRSATAQVTINASRRGATR